MSEQTTTPTEEKSGTEAEEREKEKLDLGKDPLFLLELLQSNSVEGGYLPHPRSAAAVPEGITGLRRCLNDLGKDEETFDEWERHMFLAMGQDDRWIETLLDYVYQRGWMEGHEQVPGEAHKNLQERIPETVEARAAMYLERFHPVLRQASHVQCIYQEHLGMIPFEVKSDGTTRWEVYHTPTGFTIESDVLDSAEEARKFIEQFPTLQDHTKRRRYKEWGREDL